MPLPVNQPVFISNNVAGTLLQSPPLTSFCSSAVSNTNSLTSTNNNNNNNNSSTSISNNSYSLSLESRIQSIFNINLVSSQMPSSMSLPPPFISSFLQHESDKSTRDDVQMDIGMDLAEIPLPPPLPPQPPPLPPPSTTQIQSISITAEANKEQEKKKKNTYVRTESYKTLKTELTDVMRRDMIKKLVEQISFKIIDDWQLTSSNANLPSNVLPQPVKSQLNSGNLL